MSETVEPADDWYAALNYFKELSAVRSRVQADRDSALGKLKSTLNSGGDMWPALSLAGFLDPYYTRGCVRELVRIGILHRYADAVRQLLGRLSREAAAEVLPLAIWEQLEETGDDDAYRRLAELLRYLGLDGPLRNLCAKAAASDDADVREVVDDFR
jgi:hypothetical protein